MAISDFTEALGFHPEMATGNTERRAELRRYIGLKLAANGLPVPEACGNSQEFGARRILSTYYQRLVRLDALKCPADQRIEKFLAACFDLSEDEEPLALPDTTFVLDRHGLARELSLPVSADESHSQLCSSYRVRNGVLHNPRHDRRTTSGTFHVVEGGLPIPGDKKAVPKVTFARLFRAAFHPPADTLTLPFCVNEETPAGAFVSLFLRPLLCPEIPGVAPEKTMEVRFFAPGSLVSNLDFVESIFGNGGDPFLPENDAGIDIEHFSGHTGCVILAPHLSTLTKQQLGLPEWAEATERQRRDGMCWKNPQELYNDGTPFKLTCRDERGVVVTLIADNYYGYCKKEVKTQLSYAANLAGNYEEEHAGGALAFPSYNLGDEFNGEDRDSHGRSFSQMKLLLGNQAVLRDDGSLTDRDYPNLVYVPENCRANVHDQRVSWEIDGGRHSIPFRPEHLYMTPSGFRFRLEKHPAAPSWRIIGTDADGVFCHKPCTVSGGGKSEISKSIADYLLHGPVFVADWERDQIMVDEILNRNYADRWRPDGSFVPDYSQTPSRPILDPKRSLGSVIKLLTPSSDYTDEYNEFLRGIPGYIYAVVFVIKRLHRGDAKSDWKQQFSVEIVNGHSGHELKYGDRRIVGTYLRVGLLNDSQWRTFKLRQDFAPAQKVQTEDDISVSVVLPAAALPYVSPETEGAESVKFAANCEYRLFQRPDDAIHAGLDKQTEADLSRDDNFIVNFEPLSRKQIRDICDRAVDLSRFTDPMQKLLLDSRDSGDGYVVCSNTPRKIDGAPSRNPRYLQIRPDLMLPFNRYVADMGTRLRKAVPMQQAVLHPVGGILIGRRNNPADYSRGIRPLAVYNPLHYQELPELFMDFISALTGKSPSTTGAGSEGALTKGPFNALLPITDLNAALVSYLLTGLGGFSTPAGHIGSGVRVDHDISLLIPEIWCRLDPEERSPEYLIQENLLERQTDMTHNGKPVPRSRLGYRINAGFVRRFGGRVFDNPGRVFDDAVLRPETQDEDAFADGILYISEAHQRVASQYLEDGSVELACPPLKALLHIMATGSWEGKDISHDDVRGMFTKEHMLEDGWYHERLEIRRERELELWQRHAEYLKQCIAESEPDDARRSELAGRLATAESKIADIRSPEYLSSLRGTIGADRLRPH